MTGHVFGGSETESDAITECLNLFDRKKKLPNDTKFIQTVNDTITFLKFPKENSKSIIFLFGCVSGMLIRKLTKYIIAINFSQSWQSRVVDTTLDSGKSDQMIFCIVFELIFSDE
ncbi:hypothetical protein BpHYR1_020500 [Brachionus plicatilis]|uniref:Uncharacterized protein n=1 Tax=Brachionus plicatilis TaxID=10195 RepID=A0A3M7QCW0_BRAPC|nr:hypothetical protein BpHYR1_020500 [Brachionus plicatilis]